jgi:hypothetical protein
MEQKKESYAEPTVVVHELLRDITAVTSGVVKTSDRMCQ